MSFLLGTFLQSFQRNAFTLLIRFRNILYKLLLVLLTSTVIVWLSVFLYGTFYYTYMPAVSHVKPVHLQFRWCQNEAICSFPSANVTLVKKGQEQLLMRGQQYKVYLDLEMPESPVNQQLGMFMVKINFTSRSGDIVHSSGRSAMLRYKSQLHQTISTVFFTPLLLLGSAEEKQLLSVELCDFYEEDASRPATSVTVEIQTRQIEIYSAQLRIYAHFTGLRYLMFHWPVLSAVIGIGTNLFFLSIVALLSWYRYLVSHESHEVVVRVGFDDSRTKSIEQRRSQVKDFLLREKQRQSKMRASFSSFEVPTAARIAPLKVSLERTHSLEDFPPMRSRDKLNEPSSPSTSAGLPLRRRQTSLSKLVTSGDLRRLPSVLQKLDDSDDAKTDKGTNGSETADDDYASVDQDILTMADIETDEDAKINETSLEQELGSFAEPSSSEESTVRQRHFIEQLKQ